MYTWYGDIDNTKIYNIYTNRDYLNRGNWQLCKVGDRSHEASTYCGYSVTVFSKYIFLLMLIR